MRWSLLDIEFGLAAAGAYLLVAFCCTFIGPDTSEVVVKRLQTGLPPEEVERILDTQGEYLTPPTDLPSQSEPFVPGTYPKLKTEQTEHRARFEKRYTGPFAVIDVTYEGTKGSERLSSFNRKHAIRGYVWGVGFIGLMIGLAVAEFARRVRLQREAQIVVIE
ncbi:MAG: hypothetical protein L0241_21410 [Planctomycetia bacterium]|nr:hypothetical protein [Planctomycetia bacterium]